MQPAENINIDILLSVFNGEAFIASLLDSLLLQSHQNFKVIIRDDGSNDDSPQILKAYRIKHTERIQLLPQGRHLGISSSYAQLMKHANAAYIMFCDQDDIWFPHKVQKTLELMLQTELYRSSQTPILIHTDLSICDPDLNIITESLWKYLRISPARNSFNRVLVQNMIHGCTTMINRPLLELCPDFPPGAVMYDWWLALTSSCFGTTAAVKEPTLLYRQHGANHTGVQKWSPKYLLSHISDTAGTHADLRSSYRQAGAFLEMHRERVSPQQRQMLEAFCNLDSMNAILKRFTLLRYRLFKQGFLRNLNMFLQI